MLICPVNVMHLSMQVMVIHFICKLLTSIAAICVTSTLAQAIGQLIYASVMACCDLCICDTGPTVKRHQHLQTSGMKSSIWKFTNFMPTVAVPLATRSVPEATCMVKQGYVATKHSVKLCPLCVKVKM